MLNVEEMNVENLNKKKLKHIKMIRKATRKQQINVYERYAETY